MEKIYWTRESVKFLEDIARNNNKEWFADNKSVYDNAIVLPAKRFVEDMGSELKKIIPAISYAPKIDGSIFRIYKDARINKGKAPYKTHLGIVFWEGHSRLESSCFYFHVEPPFYFSGVGMARFSAEILAEYRKSLNNKNELAELAAIKKDAEKRYYEFKGEKLKNIPKGFEALNKDGEDFLKYKTLYLSDEMPINNDFYSPELFNGVLASFKNMLPYHKWLSRIIKRAEDKKNAEHNNI